MLFKQDTAPAPLKPPRRRKKRQRQRLLSAFKLIAEGESRVTLLGEDPLFKALMLDLGGTPPTTASCQLLFDNVPITVVGVPDRLWIKPIPMGRLVRVRNRMEDLGRRCVLLPQSTLGPDRFDKRALHDMLQTLLGDVPDHVRASPSEVTPRRPAHRPPELIACAPG